MGEIPGFLFHYKIKTTRWKKIDRVIMLLNTVKQKAMSAKFWIHVFDEMESLV